MSHKVEHPPAPFRNRRPTAAELRREMGQTRITRPLAIAFVSLFLLTIGIVPVLEHSHALLQYRGGKADTTLLPAWSGITAPQPDDADAAFTSLLAHNRALLSEMRRFEDALEDHSLLNRWLLSPVQGVLTGWLGAGNEQAYPGRDGLVYYRHDIDHLIGQPFLDPRQLARRALAIDGAAPVQSDPRPALRQFAADLAERGIALVLVPAPVKPTVHPEFFGASPRQTPLYNPSQSKLATEVVGANVLWFDPAPMLLEAARHSGELQYLAADTHWTPAAVTRVAEALATLLREHDLTPAQSAVAWRTEQATASNLGDTAAMLRLPESQQIYQPQQVAINQVLTPNMAPWRPDPAATVLLLGDSFTNIFSMPELGWGESAGLAEQISLALGQPIDALTRNDAAAHATRQMLADELARSRDRLAGKRVVIYQFAARELSHGDWKVLPLVLGDPPPSAFYVPQPGAPMVVHATVHAIAPTPRPGSVPYRDHIAAVHLVDVEIEGSGNGQRVGRALAYMQGMRDNQWLPPARLRPGQRVTLRLHAWSDVAERLDRLNRAELDHDDLLFADPVYAELMQ